MPCKKPKGLDWFAERLKEMEIALPSVPILVTKAINLNEDSSSVGEVEKLIIQSPSLTARVMRIANSVLYSNLGPVSKPSQAIARLGMRGTRALILAEGIQSLAPRVAPPSQLFDQRMLWEHSVGVMCAARRLVTAVAPELDEEEISTAGLLHDLGRMILQQVAPDECQLIARLMRESGSILPVQAERAVLGCSHEDLGELLAEHWGFPKAIMSAVGNHGRETFLIEEEEEVSAAACSKPVALIYVANCLTHQAGLGHRRGPYHDLAPRALALLGLQAPDAQDTANKLHPTLAEAKVGLLKEVATARQHMGG